MIDVRGGVGILSPLVLVFVGGEGEGGDQLFRHARNFNCPANSSRTPVPESGGAEGL